ncbi:Uu.00g026150.m01.CDS01 [Anthostomella pinea]|uniref:Uu.00g026150.m01.CDS01 n=1 Tax=Anthostomella pinea TaxID=933095 RepID=A0AAI8V7Z9_9PEZI|nr:Uu.00g026150.m01.CDS01 [Anthostomella pinea]
MADEESGAEAAAQGDEPPEPSSSGPKSSITLNVPNPAVSYGRLNPEIEENVALVGDLSGDGLRTDATDRRNMLGSNLATRLPSSQDDQGSTSRGTTSSDPSTPSANQRDASHLLGLPSELIDAVFSFLSPIELATASLVCHALRQHAIADIQWQRHVLSNLPGNKIASPYPCQTWYELYTAHDPYWFLTKHKLWFCDRELAGQMVIVRYDERRGCIEGYQLVAARNRNGSEPWLADSSVHIHYFEPRVNLHLDKPVLQFDANSLENLLRNSSSPGKPSKRFRQFFAEQPMRYDHGTDPRFSNFLLARPLSESAVVDRMDKQFPYGHVWPPPAIPARHRVLGHPSGIIRPSRDHVANLSSSIFKPSTRAEASDQTFRIRQWMDLATLGVHLGEEVVTYSTLDSSLYTPTPEKPWRGIWVGDYSGHGCEFLLLNQPDDDVEGEEGPLVRSENETEEDFQERFLRERVYRGRLEAIKLTGDPNVPRGEYTFVATDLGDDGFVGVAQEPPFQGARVVKSKGHVAAMGFHQDKYIESQLILISHNRLATYWVEFGHISFFERVDIDQFLVPG